MFFSYDFDDGFVTHPTADDAKTAAQESIDAWMKWARENDELPEEIDAICWGELRETVSHDEGVEPHLKPLTEEVDKSPTPMVECLPRDSYGREIPPMPPPPPKPPRS